MESYQDVLNIAVYAGDIMLRNGAETYRVEDTISRICSALGIKYVDTFVTPTGMMVSIITPQNTTFTRVRRVTKRDINLAKIAAANEISRQLTSGKIKLEEGYESLRNVDLGEKQYNLPVVVGSAGLAAAAFTVLFGGTWTDFLPALLSSIIVQLVLIRLERVIRASFLQEFIGGIIASLLGILLLSVGLGEHLDKVILGAVLTMVPGTAMTNSVRDFISGDLLSGIIRGLEAFLIAFAIAGGVGLVISSYYQLSGGFS